MSNETIVTVVGGMARQPVVRARALPVHDVRATQLSRSGSFFQAELARIEQQEREQRRGNVIPLQLGAGA